MTQQSHDRSDKLKVYTVEKFGAFGFRRKRSNRPAGALCVVLLEIGCNGGRGGAWVDGLEGGEAPVIVASNDLHRWRSYRRGRIRSDLGGLKIVSIEFQKWGYRTG